MNRNLTFINSTFVNLENLNRNTSIAVGNVISWVSVALNVIVVYLIIRKSKNEARSYKIALVVSHVLLCLAQFLWGVLMCIAPLLPFPAFIFYGHLASHADVFILIQLWILLILSFLWALFATLVIRYRMVAFNVSRGSYWILGAVLSYVICVITIILLFEILRSSEEDTSAFIARVYPKYSYLSNYANLLILSHKPTLHISAFSCIAIFGALALITIKLITFTFFPILTLSLYFVTPEFDAISITMIFYNVFVAAPIPGTLVLIIQTPSYRNSIVGLFVRVQIVEPAMLPTMNNRMTL